MKYRVIQIVPYDALGGVEVAAKSLENSEHEWIDYRIEYLYSSPDKAKSLFSWQPAISSLVSRLNKKRPDLIVLSLWRSCLAGLFFKLFRPKVRMVLFLHSSKDVHFLDWMFNRIASFFADEIWADSQTTLVERFNGKMQLRGRVISFVARRLDAPEKLAEKVPSFVFWGRLSKEKNLLRTLEFFAEIFKIYPSASFDVIGPDAGQIVALKKKVETLGIKDVVQFLGPKTSIQIAGAASNYRFYLQTSDFEGMAMSVVEAMQLGLVPIVTPVGEIASYARDGVNAIYISDSLSNAINNLQMLIEDEEQYVSMRNEAIATWRNKALHSDSVYLACEEFALRSSA